MNGAWKVAKRLGGAIVLAVLIYAGYVALQAFGIYAAIVKNDSDREVLAALFVRDRPLAPARLQPQDWMIRLASVQNTTGSMRIECTDVQTGLKKNYGIDYVSYHMSAIELVRVDGCRGVKRLTHVNLGLISPGILDESLPPVP
jgi:hypothetical protein